VADPNADLQQKLMLQQMQLQGGLGSGGLSGRDWMTGLGGAGGGRHAVPGGRAGGSRARLQAARHAAILSQLDGNGLKKSKKDKKVKKKRASKLEYKRVDLLWDSTIHNYKLTDTAEDEESSEYDQYLFNVRRTFDWEGKYKVCESL
jgi:hypothetical protein